MQTPRVAWIPLLAGVAACAVGSPSLAPHPSNLALEVESERSGEIMVAASVPVSWIAIEVGPEERLLLQWPRVVDRVPAPAVSARLAPVGPANPPGRGPAGFARPVDQSPPCLAAAPEVLQDREAGGRYIGPQGCARFGAGGMSAASTSPAFTGYRLLIATTAVIGSVELRRVLASVRPRRDPDALADAVARVLRAGRAARWDYRVLPLHPGQ